MSTDTATDAEAICSALGTTLEEVERAGEWVDAWIELVDDGETVTTTERYGDVEVHLHQLVTDPTGDEYVVVHVDEHFVQVASPDDWTRYTYTADELDDGLVTPVTGGDGTPVFGY